MIGNREASLKTLYIYKEKIRALIYRVRQSIGALIARLRRRVLEKDASFEPLICSNCFTDQGLKLDAVRLGIEDASICPRCKVSEGAKLDKDLAIQLAVEYFAKGSFSKTEYGGAPVIEINEHHKGCGDVVLPIWLRGDADKLLDVVQGGIFYYGPRLWMLGEVYPLKRMLDTTSREEVFLEIIQKYPSFKVTNGSIFYRIRVNPSKPHDPSQYDSPPSEFLGKGRLDSTGLPVMYASPDLDACIHECRVSAEDSVLLATLKAEKDLMLLDLTQIIDEDCSEFESLDMAIHLLFFAGKHSYGTSQALAQRILLAGYDGVVYPSYFSLLRLGIRPLPTVYGLSIRRLPSYKAIAEKHVIRNYALFGRPLEKEDVSVLSIDNLIINRVEYNYSFGPAAPNVADS